MPLDGEHLRPTGQLERLDHAVVGGPGDHHPGADAPDRLVVQAVGHRLQAVQRGGTTACSDANRVATIAARPVPARVLGCIQMLHQRAAECDVQQLRAPAHAQHRDVGIQRGSNERQLPVVAAAFDRAERGMRILAVERGVGVGTTGHHQTVEAGDDLNRVGVAGELHGQSARLLDHLRVLAEVHVHLLAAQRRVVEQGDHLRRPPATRQPDQRRDHAHATFTGRRFMPQMKLLRSRSIGPSISTDCRRGSSSSNSTFSSMRANCAPRHRCGLRRLNAT